MPWKVAQPLPTWSAVQWAEFGREIFTRAKFFNFTWTPGTIAASTMVTYSMAATGTPDILTNACLGLRIGMSIKLTPPSAPAAGLLWDATVTVNDTLTIWIQNISGAAAAAPAGTWAAKGLVI